MVLNVLLKVVQKDIADTSRLESHGGNRADIPDGVFIEDKTKKTDESEPNAESNPSTDATPQSDQPESDIKAKDKEKAEDQNDLYGMTIESSGKYTRKADWSDIAGFAKMDQVNSDTLKEWLHSYQEQNFPDQLKKANCIPRTAYIKDEPKKGFDAYKTYDWKPIKLNLQPGLIDVKEQWTKDIVLEQFQMDYSTDIEAVLAKQGDKAVVSTLTRSKLSGHPLALGLSKVRSHLVTEFRGIDSVVFTLGNNAEAGTIDEETGAEVWRDEKKLRALLHGQPLPKKTGRGVSRTVDVLAHESYFKARVYYKAFFTGTVTTDHGFEQFDGQRYWNWDLKFFLRYNGIPNAVVMYEDVELHFYSGVKFNMENEDWEWVQKNGRWLRQKIEQANN